MNFKFFLQLLRHGQIIIRRILEIHYLAASDAVQMMVLFRLRVKPSNAA